MSEFNLENKPEELLTWIEKSSRLFVKKLSRNDCRWADNPENGHQNGFYVPREARESGFFPALANINREKSHIFEAEALTLWPATGQCNKSRFVHYSNKGSEMHVTRVPKEEFAGISPASLLIGGHLEREIAGAHYWFMVLDSEGTHAEWLESLLDLSVDFQYGLFDPSTILQGAKDEASMLIAELESALHSNTLPEFITEASRLPSPKQLAEEAQAIYRKQYGISSLDPWQLSKPGNTLMKISRDIEFSIYKQKERRHRAAEILSILTQQKRTGLADAIVRGFSSLDATFLSASQHRKSRAGRSFENHIAAMLRDGKIPFDEQAVTGGRRPDFVLPSLSILQEDRRAEKEAMILSAKTTLRERWKQVALERFKSPLFLGTVDDRVSSDAIDDMMSLGIVMVVPESLKAADETCYKGKDNVITFRDFFDNEVNPRKQTFWKT